MQQQASREFAQAIHLRYVDYKNQPGITRIMKRKKYIYTDADGSVITDSETLERIQKLRIPPAYTEVWISPYSDSYLQAVSKDAKGRVQYRYHPKWRKYRNQFNHARMVSFGHNLPIIRKRVYKDIKTRGLNKHKVLATVIAIMDKTLIRVGNENYVHENKSHGLTTLRNKHAKIKGNNIIFGFRGKSKKEFKISLRDSQLAKIVQRSKELPGYNLFEYKNGDTIGTVTSTDINDYLKETSRDDFSAKDFRTWWATVYCYDRLTQKKTSEMNHKNYLSETIHYVAKKLGNTPSVCKKHYIYPNLLTYFSAGKLSPNTSSVRSSPYLSSAEKQTLKFLKKEFKHSNQLQYVGS